MSFLGGLVRLVSFVLRWGLIAAGVCLLGFWVAGRFDRGGGPYRPMTVSEILQSPPMSDEPIELADVPLDTSFWLSTSSPNASWNAVAGSKRELFVKHGSSLTIQDRYRIRGTVTADHSEEIRKAFAAHPDLDPPPPDRVVYAIVPVPGWDSYNQGQVRELQSVLFWTGSIALALGGVPTAFLLFARRRAVPAVAGPAAAVPAVGSPCAGCGAVAELVPVFVSLSGGRGTRYRNRFFSASGVYPCCAGCRAWLRSLGWLKVVMFLLAFAATAVAFVVGIGIGLYGAPLATLLIGLGLAFFLYEWAMPSRIKADLKRKCAVSILTSVDRVSSAVQAQPAQASADGPVQSGETSAQ
jgi:hypothetical protein